MLAIVAPGQGSQTPGFLSPWLEDPAFRDRMTWLSTVAGVDLVEHGTTSDADTIRDTAVAQPLLVASAMVSALSLFPSPADAFAQVGVVAGHSVGELAAACASGVMSAEATMVLVRERGRAMAEASAATPTSMTAVIGGEPELVLKAIEDAGLTPANHNGPGQVVAGGTLEQLEALADLVPPRTRLIPLSVAGAFHTHHMQPAVAHLESLARAISTHDPRTRLLSNADGQVVSRGRQVLTRLVQQVASPVRWDRCMETMVGLGVTGILEMPPAGTLTGLAKRGMKGVETFALNTPDQLDDARAFCHKHASDASDLSVTPEWRMLVSPGKGQFHRAEEAAASDVLAPGSTVGVVRNIRGETPVSAPHGGQIIEWLVEDGDLVNPGQPVVRLHPAPEAF